MKKYVLFLSGLALMSCANNKKGLFQEKFNEILEKTSVVEEFPTKNVSSVERKELYVSGTLPEWLKGTYVRNGSGRPPQADKNTLHFFDGLAFLIGFNFDSGKVYYSSKFLEIDQYKELKEKGRLNLEGFAKNYGDSKLRHLSHDGQSVRTSNAAINVEKVDNNYVAFGEDPMPVAFGLNNLETKGIFDYKDTLKKRGIWESAHHKRDSKTGVLYNIYIDYGFSNEYVVYKIAPNSKTRKVIARIPVDNPSYMHDFFMTENYIVFLGTPVVVNSSNLLDKSLSFMGAHYWDDNRKTKVYVVDKKSGEVVLKTETQPLFFWHAINAYEEGNAIKIFLNRETFPTSMFNLTNQNVIDDKRKKKTDKSLVEISLDLEKKAAFVEPIIEKSFEMPSINPSFAGVKNQYAYMIQYSDSENGTKLVKYDADKKKMVALWNQTNCFVGEPLFVENTHTKEEDEGVVLSVVYDKKENKSFLVVLNAKNMKEEARIYSPHVIPMGLHGKFFR